MATEYTENRKENFSGSIGRRDGSSKVLILEEAETTERHGDTIAGGRLPERVKQCINAIPDTLLAMDESELMQMGKLTAVDERVRISFWNEVRRADNVKSVAVVRNICRGVCSEGFFYAAMRNPYRAAFIIHEVSAYDKQMESLLSIGVRRLEEILGMDITEMKAVEVDTDLDGKPIKEYHREVSPTKARLLLDTIGRVEDRVIGSAVQRVQNTNKTVGAAEQLPSPDTKLLENEIKLLKQQMGEADEVL